MSCCGAASRRWAGLSFWTSVQQGGAASGSGGRKLGRWGLGGGEPVDFGLPNVMAARMEMQRHRRAIELCFDFVLHLAGRDEHATKVARDATSFATPEANRASPAQCRDGEALCAWHLVWTRAVGGSGPVHSYTLQPRDCSWPLTSLRLCAVPTMRASTATLVASPPAPVPRVAPPGASRDFLRFAPVMEMQSNTIAHHVAKSLDFLCLPGRFPLFFGALECGT
jgi:hypothetical protein